MMPLRTLGRAAGVSARCSATASALQMLRPAPAVAAARSSGSMAAVGMVVPARRGFMMAAAAGDGKDKVVIAEDFKAFEEQTSKAERAIAYFTATWCPPCRTISPVYASLSTKHPEVAFVKVDVDANEEAASKSNIRTIPAFYFYRKGKLVGKLVGADQKKLVEQIEDLEATP